MTNRPLHVRALRVSITRACDMRCFYCRTGHEKSGHDALSLPFVARLCEALRRRFGLQLVRLTGGEPLCRPDVVEWVRRLSTLGPEVAMTTNGQRMAHVAAALHDAGLVRVNFSLDTLDEKTFERMSGGRLADTILGIEAALKAGLSPVKCNTVVMRGWNEDELADLAAWCLERGIEPRFLELMNVGVAHRHHARWFVSAEEILRRLSESYELRPLGRSPGCTAARYVAAKGGRPMGTLGIIAPESEPFCEDCARLRLSADGQLFGCFMQDRGIDLAECLSLEGAADEKLLDRLILKALSCKAGIRSLRRRRAVVEIGG